MQKNKDSFSMNDAMRLASTPAGKQLIQLLKTSGGDSLADAKQAFEKGDYDAAKAGLAEVMKSPQIQALLKELEQQK